MDGKGEWHSGFGESRSTAVDLAVIYSDYMELSSLGLSGSGGSGIVRV